MPSSTCPGNKRKALEVNILIPFIPWRLLSFENSCLDSSISFLRYDCHIVLQYGKYLECFKKGIVLDIMHKYESYTFSIFITSMENFKKLRNRK